MRVVLDLDGWRKVMEADDWVIRSGSITVSIFQPMATMLPEPDEPIRNPAAVSATFYCTGEKTAGGLPIFQYRR